MEFWKFGIVLKYLSAENIVLELRKYCQYITLKFIHVILELCNHKSFKPIREKTKEVYSAKQFKSSSFKKYLCQEPCAVFSSNYCATAALVSCNVRLFNWI